MKYSVLEWLPKHLLMACLTYSVASCGGGNSTGATTFSTTPASTVSTASAPTTSTFSATLTGGEETPPNSSQAVGTGVAIVDLATRSMRATVTTAGVAGTAAHIHNGPRGVAGPIVFALTEASMGSGIWTAQATLSQTDLNTLLAGNYYFNVHSAAFPNGEIRGQLLQQSVVSTTDVGTATGSFSTGATGTTSTP